MSTSINDIQKSNKRGNTLKADAVVIGSGIAGMTAAAMLVRSGHKVFVLERDVHAGGCAANFSKDGYNFSVGATLAMGFEKGGLHHKVYSMLGLEPRYESISPAIRVHLPEDRQVDVCTDKQQWQVELERAFPSRNLKQKERKQRFWQRMSQLAGGLSYASSHFPVLPFARLVDVFDTARAAHPSKMLSLFNVLTHLNHTVADLSAGIDDTYHAAFVDGQLLDAMQTTAEDCAAPNGALALDIYRSGCQYKVGGLASIAQDLEQYLHAHGSTVLYSTLAKEIVIEQENNKQNILGVTTNRATIEAPVVVSAIPMQNTAELLPVASTSNLNARAQRQPKMWGAFTLYLGVDEGALPKNLHFYEQITELDVHEPAGNCLVSTSPSWDDSRAPTGKRAITVSTHVDAKEWLELAKQKTAYKTAKDEFAQLMLTKVKRVIPKLEDGLEFMEAGTPRSFYNFTRRSGGTVGGIPQSLAHANFSAPSHHTDISGLFLAGDTVFPGQGTIGVTVSGYNAARSANRYLRTQY